jgi:hypothetical protein
MLQHFAGCRFLQQHFIIQDFKKRQVLAGALTFAVIMGAQAGGLPCSICPD